jgi:hypothetical protein
VILPRRILTWIILIDITFFFPKQILWFLVIKVLIKIIRSSFWNATTWGFLVIKTPAVPLSGIIPWKVVSEYQLLRVKAELIKSLLKILTLGLLKISTFVIVYSMDWLLRAIIISVLSFCPNLVKNLYLHVFCRLLYLLVIALFLLVRFVLTDF